MIAKGFQLNSAAFGNQLLGDVIELILVVIVLWILWGIVRFIFRILKGFWNLLFGRRKRADPLQSDDWLTRAQAKQEIRFKNSLPPLLPKQQPRKKRKRLFKRKGEGETWYPSGWKLNEETGLWEPPDYMK